MGENLACRLNDNRRSRGTIGWGKLGVHRILGRGNRTGTSSPRLVDRAGTLPGVVAPPAPPRFDPGLEGETSLRFSIWRCAPEEIVPRQSYRANMPPLRGSGFRGAHVP